MSILAFLSLRSENKKCQWQNVTPSGNRTQASNNLWLQVQHFPFWTNLAFACKTESLGSLYSNAVLILTQSSKSKNQVVHEQKFKDLLSSTCLTSSERRLLDLESEIMRGLVSIPIQGNILSLDFFCFHAVKTKMLILHFRIDCEKIERSYSFCVAFSWKKWLTHMKSDSGLCLIT